MMNLEKLKDLHQTLSTFENATRKFPYHLLYKKQSHPKIILGILSAAELQEM